MTTMSKVRPEPKVKLIAASGNVSVRLQRSSKARKIADHDLEDSVPYLLARAGMRMGQAFTQELKQFELTLTEWRVCVALFHEPQQRLADLAMHTSTDPSTLSRTVDGLLRRHLLIRGRSNADGRALALSLTAEGSELAQRVIPLAQLYERIALANFNAEQSRALRDGLKQVFENMALLDPAN
ncbi:MAG: MarR family transcriptional regulator [Variovorax sp.]